MKLLCLFLLLLGTSYKVNAGVVYDPRLRCVEVNNGRVCATSEDHGPSPWERPGWRETIPLFQESDPINRDDMYPVRIIDHPSEYGYCGGYTTTFQIVKESVSNTLNVGDQVMSSDSFENIRISVRLEDDESTCSIQVEIDNDSHTCSTCTAEDRNINGRFTADCTNLPYGGREVMQESPYPSVGFLYPFTVVLPLRGGPVGPASSPGSANPPPPPASSATTTTTQDH